MKSISMAHIQLPYFDPIDPFSVDEEYTDELELRGVEVLLHMIFESHIIEPGKLQSVKNILDHLPAIDAKNRQLLKDHYADPNIVTVRYYLQYLQRKVWRSSLELLVDFSNPTTPPLEQMLESMHLISIGFYPDNEGRFVVFDYCIGLEYTDYFLALNGNEQGELIEMTMER